MHKAGDNSFVSINLETSESCDMCGLDTGERLTSSCQLCIRKSTQGPIQKGFNKMPDVLHGEVVAHESCLAKSHQAMLQVRHSYHSPLLLRRGTSVPSDFLSLGLRDTVGDKHQWIINYAKNEDMKNKQNRLQVHSNPCSRPSSPVIFRALTEEALLRRNSENDLKDSSFVELGKSYAKYLHGSSIPKSHSDDSIPKSHRDDSIGCKTRSSPIICIDNTDSDKPQFKSKHPDTKVPNCGSVKGQTQLPAKTIKKENTVLESKTQSEGFESTENNNMTSMSTGSKLNSRSIINAVVREDEEKVRTEQNESRNWSNKQKMDQEQLNKMSPAEIKKVVSSLENIIKAISAELVDLLQERDSLDQEVKVRNLTIQKLVKMKHSQQDAPIKTTGVGNI